MTMPPNPKPVAWRGEVPLHLCIERCGRLVPFKPRLCDACCRQVRNERPTESLRDFRKRLKGAN